MAEHTKRIHFKIDTWGYGEDAREAFADVLDTISGWDPHDPPLPVREVQVLRCAECGGEIGESAENPCAEGEDCEKPNDKYEVYVWVNRTVGYKVRVTAGSPGLALEAAQDKLQDADENVREVNNIVNDTGTGSCELVKEDD